MTDKEQIKCNYKFQDKERFDGRPYCTCFDRLCEDLFFICDNNCQIYEDLKQLARKRQECEELKKQLETSEEWRIKAESLNEKLNLENTCYRKALEEIESIIKDYDCANCTEQHCIDCNKYEIFDIINKARRKNERQIKV